MKSKMLGKCFAPIAICALVWAVFGCSESSTAGGTVDDNSVVAISADEKAVLEHQVDSTKVFADAETADIDNYGIDSSVYWYEVNFSGERENYFAYEEENPYSYCYVSIYQSDFGVRTIEYLPTGENYMRTFFLTADDYGVVYHEKIDYDYNNDISRCERDFSDFEQSCENEGGTLYNHKSACAENRLRLTCTMPKGHLLLESEKILNDYAEGMKNWCLENR